MKFESKSRQSRCHQNECLLQYYSDSSSHSVSLVTQPTAFVQSSQKMIHDLSDSLGLTSQNPFPQLYWEVSCSFFLWEHWVFCWLSWSFSAVPWLCGCKDRFLCFSVSELFKAVLVCTLPSAAESCPTAFRLFRNAWNLHKLIHEILNWECLDSILVCSPTAYHKPERENQIKWW